MGDEHRPVFKPCIAKPIKSLNRESLQREIFDEAMLDTSYSTNLAYKTSNPKAQRSNTYATRSSKIVRLKKSASSIFTNPNANAQRQPNIYDSLKKPNQMTSGFRINLQNDDMAGKRTLKFMGDLSNPNHRSTQRFHMVKGADRRDVQENIDRVANEYLDEMLNKMADF